MKCVILLFCRLTNNCLIIITIIIVAFVRLLGRTVTYHPRHTGGGIRRCAAFHFSFDMHSDDSSDADVVSDSPFRMYVVCYVGSPLRSDWSPQSLPSSLHGMTMAKLWPARNHSWRDAVGEGGNRISRASRTSKQRWFCSLVRRCTTNLHNNSLIKNLPHEAANSMSAVPHAVPNRPCLLSPCLFVLWACYPTLTDYIVKCL